MPIMTLENVSYIYGEGTPDEIRALEDINMSIEQGEFIGLMGHTGSGKSTLIQHLNGLIKPTHGTITFHGEDIYKEGYSLKQLRSKVGLVFQYPEHQLFEMDVFTDVCFGPKNLGLSKEEIEERAKKALTMTGLDESYYTKSPFELSGGQKRRVAIAGVLAMEPDILILDEPTAGLDPLGRDEILGEIQKLHEGKNMTIILVSHSMEDIAQYADRIIVMNKGHKIMDDKPVKIFECYQELEKVGLAAPQVTYLMHDLQLAGVKIDPDVITVGQAKEQLLNLYQSAKEKGEGKC